MTGRSRLPIVVSMVLGLASAGVAAPIPLTTCGGTIPAGQRGVLQNDVTCEWRCSGDPSIVCGYGGDDLCSGGHGACVPDVFVLEDGATLDLDGHTIELAYQSSAARCGHAATDPGRCIVKGPGTLAGAKGTAIQGRSMDLVVKNVTIGFCDGAIFTHGRLTVEGVTTLSDRENSIYSARDLTLRNSHLDGDSGAYADGDVRVENVEIGPHGGGIAAGGTVRGHDVLLQKYTGVNARDVVLRRVTTVPDDVTPGVPVVAAKRRLRLVDSTLVGIASGKAPVLVRSTCDSSTLYDGTATWGVCSAD